MDYFEKPVSDQLIAKGGIVEFHNVTVELPNGKLAGRDLVKHPGASVVVPVSDDGCVYMVRQYRTPAKQETIEIPAGKLDAGEDPLVCAARELSEEDFANVGRNEPCPCGSGRRFKHCHGMQNFN